MLLPFLDKAHTIDDPVFLREAQQVLRDPLHPTAFQIVWNPMERRLPASAFLPGGPVIAYLLLPAALADGAEWVAHLIQLAALLVAIAATVSLALRLGSSARQASAAGLLVAATPAVLGMAGSSMPDVPALMFAALAMERVWAFVAERSRARGLLASLWLALAALTRIQLLLLIPVGAVLLLASAVRRGELRGRSILAGAWPFAIAALAVPLALIATRDPTPAGGTPLSATLPLLGWSSLPRHALAYLVGWALAVPLTLPWAAGSWIGRRGGAARLPLLGVLALAALLACWLHSWAVAPAVLTLAVFAGIMWGTIRSGDPGQLALAAWLLVPLPILVYINFAPKYLVPCAPAAALLVVREWALLPPRSQTRLLAATAAAGTALGVLILRADASMGEAARAAAARLIEPRTAQGQRIWFAGHWGFQWYAERAGAEPLSLDGPYPEVGDLVVTQRACDPPHRRLVESIPRGRRAGQVMSRPAGAGFYSDWWGLLPWAWGPPDGQGFRVYEVRSPLGRSLPCDY